jgi:hypothetical protein
LPFAVVQYAATFAGAVWPAALACLAVLGGSFLTLVLWQSPVPWQVQAAFLQLPALAWRLA